MKFLLLALCSIGILSVESQNSTSGVEKQRSGGFHARRAYEKPHGQFSDFWSPKLVTLGNPLPTSNLTLQQYGYNRSEVVWMRSDEPPLPSSRWRCESPPSMGIPIRFTVDEVAGTELNMTLVEPSNINAMMTCVYGACQGHVGDRTFNVTREDENYGGYHVRTNWDGASLNVTADEQAKRITFVTDQAQFEMSRWNWFEHSQFIAHGFINDEILIPYFLAQIGMQTLYNFATITEHGRWIWDDMPLILN